MHYRTEQASHMMNFLFFFEEEKKIEILQRKKIG